ncbi:MAG: hypothetical protein M8866_05090 [marine benthic group bacterium]|nr:hypothetical protein [Candidatus Benthicola marisminoris]
MARIHRIARLAAVLALTGSACATNKQIEIGEIPADGSVTLTLLDGDELKMRHAAVEADSVRGQIQRTARLGGPIWADTVAVAIAEIEGVEVSESDGAATAGLIVAIIALPTLMLVAACSESDGYVC